MPSKRLAALLFAITCGLLLAAAQDDPRDESADGQSVAEKNILAAFEQPTKLDGEDITLQETVDFLAEFHEIPIMVDRKALADAGVDLESPLDARQYRGLKLKHVLRFLLPELDLAWVIENEVLLITTRDVADTKLITKAYPVADLLAVRDIYGRVDELFRDEAAVGEELKYAIGGNMNTHVWLATGGVGSMSTLKGTLVVSNSREVHEQVKRLVDGLRTAREQQFAADAAGRYSTVYVDESLDQRRIQTALATKIKWDFHETPLGEVAAAIAETHGFPVLLEQKALADAGIDPLSRVTIRVEGVSLDSGLRLMLRELDLAYVVADDVLQITTRDVADTRFVSRIYPVRDLVVDAETDTVDFYLLTGLIQTSIAPDVWEANGGEGSLTAFEGSFCLVANSTSDALTELERVLAQLRKSASYQEPPLTPLADADPAEQVRLRVYDVTPMCLLPRLPAEPTTAESPAQAEARVAAKLQKIVEVVQEAVGPEAWKEDGVFLQALSDRIAVKHNGRVHRQVRKALLDLGIDSTLGPGFGGRSSNAFGEGHGPYDNFGSFGGGGFF